jgi:ATP-dependent RNA helicase DDX24/MAK5
MMPGVESNSKRRTHASSSNARKKVKRSRLSSNDLPWKPVPRSTGSLTKEDGILELEEVDDVEIVYEETEHGKIAKFNVSWHFPSQA